MDTKKKYKRGFGLFRNFGWKKNLLAMLAGFLICSALYYIPEKLNVSGLLAHFDFSIAVMPLVIFAFSGWGAIGVFASCVFSTVTVIVEFWNYAPWDLFWACFGNDITTLIYSILPSVLWYSIPLKNEKYVHYPRLDTAAHAVKYYLVMVVSVAAYVAMMGIMYAVQGIGMGVLGWAVIFTQYLDVVLIVGMLLLVALSVARNRTITINERMVLAFLLVGVLASALCGYLVYRTMLYLEPDMFEKIERLYGAVTNWTEEDGQIMEQMDRFWNWFYVIMAIMLNVLLIVEMFFMRGIEKKVTKPILHLADVLEEYTFNADKEEASGIVAEKCAPYVNGYGEVSSLTDTCVEMVSEINDYTKNLQQVTAEKERIGTELDVASNIQNDMLPRIFPPFPERSEMTLFASMTPAKEVGGDFYDFYLIDRDHLALTIADVSGKGVPAALFMVISKTLLNNHAQSSLSPKEILTFVNNRLCMSNESLMFCTVWLGILDLRDGHLTAANAGHEYPMIRRAGGEFERLQDKHDPPLGLKDGLRYHEYELTLAPGDCLFEYTDGVTEATDASLELFGDDRLKEALNAVPADGPAEQIARVHEAIDTFVKEAPQFDDITMLCVEYHGSDGSAETVKAEVTIPADVNSLPQMTQFVEEQLEGISCPPDIIFSMELAAEEIFANIANYAYDGKEGDMTLTFTYEEKEKKAGFIFTDSGIPFDPTLRPDPDITLGADERQIGGLGIHIVKKTMDEVRYEYSGGKNVLTIGKIVK